MTTTSFNVGLSDDARLSSRVLRPPGGGHTDIFGSEPEPVRTGRRFTPQPNAQADNIATPKPAKEPEQSASADTPVSESGTEAPAPEPTQEPASNVEQQQEPSKPEPTKTEPAKPAVEPPRRVRVPPGGFSSGLW